MARPKRLTAHAVSNSALELLEKMRDHVGAARYRDDKGNLITGQNYDPVLVLARLSVDPTLKPAERLAAAREAARYVH